MFTHCKQLQDDNGVCLWETERWIQTRRLEATGESLSGIKTVSCVLHNFCKNKDGVL